MVTQKHKLNTIPGRVMPTVFVSQFDETRRIYFDLYQGDDAFTPSGTVKAIIGTTQINGTIDGTSVYFDIPRSLTQKATSLFGEVVIVDNGILGTCNFQFIVEGTPHESESEETDTDRALSILMGRSVKSPDSAKAVNILLGGE